MTNNIETKLSLSEDLNDIISDVQKEIMEEELSELNSIKENDINIATTYTFDNGEYIEAKVYFRNGLSKKVNFEYVQLFMLNSENEIVGKKVFDLREMGDLPPGTARPWKLFFEKSEINMSKFSKEGCKVVFSTGLKAVNYAPITLDESSIEDKQYSQMFEDFIKTLPGIEKGNISISKFKITLQKQGNIIITLVIRNGCDKPVALEKLPITIKDEKGTIVASSIFETKDLKVESMKARVCNFVFETKLNIEQSFIMDKWSVFFE
ncbi:SLAP domain-containing protein [Clostridium sp.]|uniref:SLAP domain-containing protein n=1 Tax=Clostridium sp. TaxID=1506 RepID=UPI002FDEFDCF